MKMKDYLEKIQNLVKDRPELLEAEVVYSSDDEGNSYHSIYYDPTPGYLTEENEWIDENGIEEHIEEGWDAPDCAHKGIPNSVCIN